MADLAAVFRIVSRASKLALELYTIAATTPNAVDGISRITGSISSFSSTVKHVGTIIREDDSLPSLEANETLDDVLDQCNSVLTEFESLVPVQSTDRNGKIEKYHHGPNHDFQLATIAKARLVYLTAHLESLRSTLSVMLQTLHTAQSIIWARTRPTISPQQAAAAISSEKMQLETLIIEQQMSILSASKVYHPSRPDSHLLMEDDSSKSLVSIEENGTPNPADLFRYQERFIASLDTSDATENDWLPAICGVSKSHLERLLEKWTRLRQLQDMIDDDERRVEAQRRETQQPTVESDIEDEVGALPKFRSNGARLTTPMPLRPGSIQPLFTESTTLPIPVPDSNFGPIAPLSPASSYGVSPRTTGNSLPSANAVAYSPVSPRSSISSLPVEAAAAVQAKDNDDEVNLEIPWKLCSRQNYWDYIDSKVVQTNTDLSPPNPFSDRNAWTEILASWVCKEAIKESGFSFTKVQKDRLDGRRTKFETCFCIQQPLTFDQVQLLVERTVELYRQNQPPSPPPPERRTSIDRPQSSHITRLSQDGDRTPLANQHQNQAPRNSYPPLNRSSSFAYPPPPPPPLDRSLSMPGPVPVYQPLPPMNPHATNLHLPIPPGPYTPHAAPYSPQAALYSPSTFQAPGAPFFAPPPLIDPRRPPNTNVTSNLNTVTFPPALPPALPPRHPSQSKPRSRHDDWSSASTTSESDTAAVARSRKHRSRSRRPSSGRRTKHSTVGTLAKVGGLAALLDGFVDLGVL
ncbi:hypothetical protein K505DRAFT_247659 [Melanomma pulvis-pyrius CBS 109.77]|uniref:Fungal N-terminal domain-containing protein n=1 Tax=Melanomma pulvis-pyrius CBS 109.77 TaxID=1314802 RepID=A0A6A6X6X0_9PLEO|nr:hypothetical protein K505DRAFT_247659 [Melanomma pulvis-pyrius CBS 109.77]